MIDRGALVLAPFAGAPYRGVYRPPLDAQHFTGRRGRDLARRYREALVAGEGVIEDLDEAVALRDAATRIGIVGLEVVVFEIPQEPAPSARALPIAPLPPAEGLVLLGYDVIEPIEPFWSPLATASPPCPVNEHGLIARRADAEAFAQRENERGASEDVLVAVRVWALPAGG
jgi:hypothetical protein